MAAPAAARARLFPLYAFNLEVARAPWVTQEPMIAEMRLQWWRDTVEMLRGDGPARAHEVVGPLAEVVRGQGLPLAVMDRLIAARRWDIYREPFEDQAALDGLSGGYGRRADVAACRALGAARRGRARRAGCGLGGGAGRVPAGGARA